MGYIYKATNVVNGKVYIGQTIRTVEARWKDHAWDANRKDGPKYCSSFHQALRKYSIDNFTIEEIEECEDCLLDEREVFWIDFYHSTDNRYGYNLTTGGCGGYLRTPETEETRLKKSEVKTGYKNPFFGRHHTNKHRSCISTPVVSFTDDGRIYKYYVSQIAANRDGYQQSHITNCVKGKVLHHGKTPEGTRLQWRNATESESDVVRACFIENNVECLTSQEYQKYSKGA